MDRIECCCPFWAIHQLKLNAKGLKSESSLSKKGGIQFKKAGKRQKNVSSFNDCIVINIRSYYAYYQLSVRKEEAGKPCELNKLPWAQLLKA